MTTPIIPLLPEGAAEKPDPDAKFTVISYAQPLIAVIQDRRCTTCFRYFAPDYSESLSHFVDTDAGHLEVSFCWPCIEERTHAEGS